MGLEIVEDKLLHSLFRRLWIWRWVRALHPISVFALLRTDRRDDENRRSDDDEEADQSENKYIYEDACNEGSDPNGKDDTVALAGALLEAVYQIVGVYEIHLKQNFRCALSPKNV